jgi:two-component system, NarL family, sensor histidine kinase DesK
VREAVTNVLKHADATWCRCEVGLVGDELHLTMTNDGARPAPARRPPGSGGAGLLGVVERVGTLGGDTAATRGPAGTYVLTVRLPRTPPGTGHDEAGQDVAGQDVAGQDVAGQDVTDQDDQGRELTA